ncbi:MAG TPA: aldehyde dehydrogenase family protein [Gemmatimonadaceae bacterium]|nr:aldehyde dehydrogenase family protein [Gemmatimonadaceae bacterium]
MTDITKLKHYIGGQWTPTAGDDWIADLNPSDTRDVVAHVPRGTLDDVTAAVAAAGRALEPWKSLAGPARAEHLYKWAAVIAERQEDLAQAMTREVGKPIGESRGEAARCTAILRYYAGEAVRQMGELIPAQAAGALQFSLREPLGVVALITPWNFPAAIPLWKAAPAIAFGNTVVLKPAEGSALVASLLAETAHAAGLPAGVFNVLQGAGSVLGPALIGAAGVRGVSFTGSAAVGAQVAAAASARNIRYQTEMGGKNVAIVLPDADLAQAASLTAAGAMRYAGQKCTATSRVIVAREVEDAFLARLREQVAALPLGPVTDPKAAVGPVITEQSRASLARALAQAGGEQIVPTAIPATAEFANGYFVAPTIVRGISPDAPVAQQELFGPVLAWLTADDLDHALALANGTAYGLSASLFTKNIPAALQYIRRIDVGLVRVNGDTTGVDPHAPFGGMRGSSSGSREQGPAAREFYTEIKTVQINP